MSYPNSYDVAVVGAGHAGVEAALACARRGLETALFSLSLDDAYCSRMHDSLGAVLEEISDLSVPWRRTDDEGKCKYCDFRAICGR